MLKKVILLLALLGLILLALRLYSRKPGHILFISSHTQFKNEGAQIALTFDDGPSEDITPGLLDLLKRHEIKATFFANGNRLLKYPEIARRIVAEGHQLANHTYAHERMVFKSLSYIKQDLLRTDQLIQQSGQQDLSYFRPTYGDKFIMLPIVLSQLNKHCIEWDINPTNQYEDQLNGQLLIEQITQSAKPGSIILLHDGWSMAPDTFIHSLEESILILKQKGFTFVRINDVIR